MAYTQICWIDKFCDTVSSISSFDCIIFTNWDGVKDPTTMDWHTDPYGFVYDRAEDYCGFVTHDGEEYCWDNWTDITGTNVVLKFEPGTTESMNYYKTAYVGIHSDGTVDYYDCSGTVEDGVYYIKIDSKPEHLYAYTDPNAGTPLYGWTQDNVDYYTKSATPVVGMPLYDDTGVATGDSIYQVNQDGTWDLPPVTLTVNPIPSDAIVMFNTAGTVSGNSITVPYNTTVSYYVVRSSLETQNKSTTVRSDTTEIVTLSYASGTVLFESSTAGTYSVTPLVPTDVNVICVGGGGGGCAAYVTNGSGYQNATAAGGGGSGGYSNQNVTIPAAQTSITVGRGGTGTSGGYNRDGGNWSATAGGSSSVSNLVSAAGGTGASAGTSYSSFTHNVAASGGYGSGGSGTTSNGNNGGSDDDSNMYTMKTDSYANGGVSVYNNYGKGGGARATVQTVDVLTLFGDNGESGYVKITVI